VAKKAGAKPAAPRILFAEARLKGRSGLQAGARRFGEKFDDIKSPAGASRTYNYAAIISVAENLAGGRLDDRQSWFFDRVRDACDRQRPRVEVPSDNRTMGRIIGDVYKRAKNITSR